VPVALTTISSSMTPWGRNLSPSR